MNICNFRTILLNNPNSFISKLNVSIQRTKHWNPKYKKERKEKVMRINLSEIQNTFQDISHDERRKKLKEKGILPEKPWIEKPMYISCTSDIFEPYVPPEGDGKLSVISKLGAKQNVEFLMKKTKSLQAFKKIKKYEEEFDANSFANHALNIYIKAHSALARKDKTELIKNITERLYPEIIYNLDDKTLLWSYIKSIELPRIVHARCTSLIKNDNLFAQITVRLHSEQILAIYDRFGRLMSGSEILKKDVLEYIVLEKHLSNEYGCWRLHSKIIPSWISFRHSTAKTFTIS